MTSPLLHLVPTPVWRECLAAGVIAPSVAEFVHLSTAAQVALPAGRLFAGRPDLLLLALDPDRIGVPVRFEAGLPTDPPEMRFPHAYGPIPTSAVLAVLPYRPRPDGGFDAPVVPELDPAARLAGIATSRLRRAAGTEVPVTGGVAVIGGASRQHDQLLIDGPTTADDLVADADRVLGGRPHRLARLTGAAAADVATELDRRGWAVEELVVMGVAPPASGDDGVVELVDRDALGPMWDELIRVEAGPPNPDLVQAADRFHVEQGVADVRYLAVRADGAVVASCVLTVDGGTAWVEAMLTLPDHRGRGLGSALLGRCLAVAEGTGCDLVGLEALADDWPRHWYARQGFAEVSRSWSAELAIAI